MRTAKAKHFALVIKKEEGGVWVAELRGHLVSEQEVNITGLALSEGRSAMLLRPSICVYMCVCVCGGGNKHCAHYVGRM